MRKIILHTACVDNSGKRRTAGEELGVGSANDQIVAERAADLVNRGMAADLSKAAAKDAE